MGFPMAGHLAAAGHEVRVFNRTTAVAERWGEEHEGVVAATPAEAAGGAEFVFTCVGADNDLRAVVLGDDGVLSTMPAGSVLVDHTTASAEVARELADVCAEQGIGWLDAPISGGQAGAENGVLTVMCGGEPEHFDAAQPVMDAYSSAVTLMGPAGIGPAHQDGQPDPLRRRGAGGSRGPGLRRAGRSRHGEGAGRGHQRERPVRGTCKIGATPWWPTSSTSVSPSTG